MSAFRCLLIVSVAAAAEALGFIHRGPLDTPDDAFQAVSSKLDEFHAELAKAKADELKTVTEQKAEFDVKLTQLVNRNHGVEIANAKLAEDIRNLRTSNIELRENASDLREECQHITAELQELQSNISMAQEFIARSVNSTGHGLHDTPALRILAELDGADAVEERQKHHERRLNDLEHAGEHLAMIQIVAARKNATQGLLEELLSSWNSVSDQHSSSLSTLQEAFNKEQEGMDEKYQTFVREGAELNRTKIAEETLNIKLRNAVSHLKISRDHLLRERVALQKFSDRLGSLPIPGVVAPEPISVALPGMHAAATAEERPGDASAPKLSLVQWLR